MARYHPLLNALVAPAQQLGQGRPQGVGIPQPLPGQLRFGPVAPGLAQNSPFSGARVAAPGSPLQPAPAATFAPAAQAGGGLAASSLAPFMQTPQGGVATLPIPGAGGGTGGVTPPPWVPTNGPVQAPTPNTFGTMLTPPPPTLGPGGIPSPFGGAPTSSILTSILSAIGQKYNPSVTPFHVSSGAGSGGVSSF